MLGGYEQDPVQHDLATVPGDFRIEDLPLNLSVLRRLADSVATQFPVFRDVALQEHRGGLPTMTPDGEHVLGPAPGVEGLWVIGGCCVGGLSTAPALGQLLAEYIVTGRPSMDVSFMAADRLSLDVSEYKLRALCRLQYAHHYWAPQTVPDRCETARGPDADWRKISGPNMLQRGHTRGAVQPGRRRIAGVRRDQLGRVGVPVAAEPKLQFSPRLRCGEDRAGA